MPRFLSISTIICFSIALVLGPCRSLFGSPNGLEVAQHNPLLRGFFWEKAVRASVVTDAFGNQRLMGSPATVAQRAEYMFADFLTKTQTRLANLRSTVEEVKSIRAKLLSLPPSSPGKKVLRSQWKRRMGDVADQANGLRKKLSFPFLGLESKEKFKYGPFPSFEETAFEKEVQLLSSQLSEAEIRINDYLFSPTHTISVEQLMGENMLINLYRVHKLSEMIEKSIPEEDT